MQSATNNVRVAPAPAWVRATIQIPVSLPEAISNRVFATASGVGLIVGFAYKIAVGATNGDLFAIPFDGPFTAVLIAALFAGGAVVGAIGSYLGVRRFLAA